MRQLWVVILLLLIPMGPAILTGLVHPRSPWRVAALHDKMLVALDEALKLPDVLWIDARPTAAYEKQHKPGALPLSEDDWDDQIDEVMLAWQPQQVVVVYCDGKACQASLHVARRLQGEVGIEPVRVLAGGWNAWLAHENGQ